MGFAIFCGVIFISFLITLKQLSKDQDDLYDPDFKSLLFRFWNQDE